MVTTNKITIQIDNEIIELKGAEKEAFEADRKAIREEKEKVELVLQAQKELKISAYKKLGLTDEEIATII